MIRTIQILGCSLLFSCGGGSSTPVDSKLVTDGAKLVDGSSSTTDAADECAAGYISTSIASMRMGTKTGCFALSNVITLGVTPSSKSPRLFVQDAGGGDFSALMLKCSSTSTTHPCSVAATVAALADGHSVSIQGTYIKTAATTFEEFFIDTVTDNGPGTSPAAGTATLAQIERASTAVNLRFQRVTIAVGANDTLKMYDWTPAEFANATGTACSYQFGFGMIPKSVAGITAGAACTTGTTQPSGIAAPNAAEVLIGTDFFDGFTTSSDCRCAKMYMDMEPVAASTLGGTIAGLLVFDVLFGQSTGYTYLAPKTLTDAPITGTVAGM